MRRISTRRCLSMLRDARLGNELALPAINASYPPEVLTVGYATAALLYVVLDLGAAEILPHECLLYMQ